MGKTSIIRRFVQDEFHDGRKVTKMAAMLNKVIEAHNSTQNLMIWDTMGQEKYNSLAPFYYRGSRDLNQMQTSSWWCSTKEMPGASSGSRNS